MRAWGLIGGLVLGAALAAAAPARALTNEQIPGLQVALRAHGLYPGPIDGIAGPQTARAVRAFQRLKRLRVDGIPGRRTRLALGPLGQPLYGRRVLVRGAVGWDVSVLQFLLARRGVLPPAAIDGRLGPVTARAVRRFQRRTGLAVDGIAGPATLSLLGSSRSLARAPAPSPRVSVSTLLDHWARRYSLDPRLLRALAWQESGHQNHVVSSAGAIGVMQVTRATWAFVETVLLRRRIPRTADGNIRVGAAFLHHLMHVFRFNERLALAAYFQGARSVRKHGLFPVTRRYVANVLALKARI